MLQLGNVLRPDLFDCEAVLRAAVGRRRDFLSSIDEGITALAQLHPQPTSFKEGSMTHVK